MSNRVEVARKLREEDGLTYREVGAFLGVSPTTIIRWLNPAKAEQDRVKSRQWKRDHRGACNVCGGPTDVSRGLAYRPPVCQWCLRWTKAAVITAFQEHTERTGITPRTADARASGGLLPHPQAVTRLFGSWNQALLEAGLPLVCDRRPETTEAMWAMAQAGASLGAIGQEYGCTARAVHLRLQRAGLLPPPRTRAA